VKPRGDAHVHAVVAPKPAPTALIPVTPATPGPNLVPGSNPAALPGSILIADHLNNRLLIVAPDGTNLWEFPQPGDLAPGQTFLVPDDAFFTPDGRYILATQEDDSVISLIDITHRQIVWRYGTPGQPGSGPNQLSNPDDAIMMPNGDIVLADIKNCRLLVLRPPRTTPFQVIGQPGFGCNHAPPAGWGSPNGAFPMVDGHYLVTEINGPWVDEVDLQGHVYWSVQPPGESYPSVTNEVSPGVYLSTSYSAPGVIEEFDQAGRPLWVYQPAPGASPLNHPSLALPLPNGMILANDDLNHRVIVIDPRTNQIVWQYGHTGTAGSAPGYLNDPDGVDLMPPFALTSTHAPTMGVLDGGGSLPGGLYGPGAIPSSPHRAVANNLP
jgi:DNA-binding beta-propeller fold protein YncE